MPPCLAPGFFRLFLAVAAGLCARDAEARAPELGAPNQAESEYVVQRWTVDDGLPQLGVRALTQTRDGYLWVGTFRGLARFDGARFASFGVGNTPAMASDYITALTEDPSGNLWIGAMRSTSLRFDGRQFHALAGPADPAPRTVANFLTDALGRTFGISENRLVLIERDRVFTAAERPWLSTSVVWSAAADPRGVIWASSEGYLVRVEGERCETVAAPGFPVPALTLAIAPDGAMWAGGSSGLFVGRDGEFQPRRGFPEVAPKGLLLARNGDIWAPTTLGLFRLRSGQLKRFTTADGLAHDSVFCVAEDRQGNIWAGSEEAGLYRLTERRVAAWPLGQHGLPNASCNAFAEDDEGRLVVSSAKGLFALTHGRFENLGPIAEPGAYFEPSALDRQPDGTWWVGSYGQGAFRGRPGHWTRYFVDGVFGPHHWVNAIYAERDGTVWIATTHAVLHDDQGRVTRHAELHGVPMRDVQAIARDRLGNLWLGTHDQGLVQISGGKAKVWRRGDGLGSDTVHGILEDREGRLWIATNGGGVALFDNDRLQRWTMADGLDGNIILQLLEDEFGNLWLGSENGISRIRPQDLLDQAEGKIPRVHPLRLGRADGAPSNQGEVITSASKLRLRDGRLCFTMPDGIAILDPKTIHPDPTRPEVLIEEVRANDAVAPMEREGNPSEPSVSFAPGAERVEFQYTGFDFNAPDRIQFRYRLQGFDREWVEAGTRRTAFYTRIPPGAYKFHVIAGNRDNSWNETGASLAVTVAPFFWETLGFRAVTAASALAAAGLAVRHASQRRLKRRLEELERQRALERERDRIARDMHDDVGARLTEIALLTDLTQRDVPEQGPAHAQIAQVSALSRAVSKSLRDVVWAMNPQNDRLDHLGEYLCQHAGNFLQHAQIRLRLEVPPELPQTPVGAEARHNLLLAFKEALNNAAKHSGAAEIRLHIALQNDSFIVELSDNGKGFDSTRPRMGGNGLHNMAKRLRECGGGCELTSRPGEGARVRFALPLPKRR